MCDKIKNMSRFVEIDIEGSLRRIPLPPLSDDVAGGAATIENRWIEYDFDKARQRILLPPGLHADYIDRVARDDNASVLIIGETGTGKDALAKYIWAKSGRAGRKFKSKTKSATDSDTPSENQPKRAQKPEIVFNDRDLLFRITNCAAISSALAMSEWFGHVQGSFTNAMKDRAGILGSLDDGTIIMDEIGELALSDQGALLQFLETGEVRRVGSDKVETRVDVRTIATTNVDVHDPSRFRSDLRHRFDYVIELPPLRKRREDIPLLLATFLRGEGEYFVGIEVGCLANLMSKEWPGNIRELSKFCFRLRSYGHDRAQSIIDNAMSRAESFDDKSNRPPSKSSVADACEDSHAKIDVAALVERNDRIVSEDVLVRATEGRVDYWSKPNMPLVPAELSIHSVPVGTIARYMLRTRSETSFLNFIKRAEEDPCLKNTLLVLANLNDSYRDERDETHLRRDYLLFENLLSGGIRCVSVGYLDDPPRFGRQTETRDITCGEFLARLLCYPAEEVDRRKKNLLSCPAEEVEKMRKYAQQMPGYGAGVKRQSEVDQLAPESVEGANLLANRLIDSYTRLLSYPAAVVAEMKKSDTQKSVAGSKSVKESAPNFPVSIEDQMLGSIVHVTLSNCFMKQIMLLPRIDDSPIPPLKESKAPQVRPAKATPGKPQSISDDELVGMLRNAHEANESWDKAEKRFHVRGAVGCVYQSPRSLRRRIDDIVDPAVQAEAKRLYKAIPNKPV